MQNEIELTKVVEIERRDEQQIVAELQGAILEEFFYQFQVATPEGPRTVTGLSYAGVKWIAQRMGNILVDEPIIEDAASSYRAKCKAKDVASNLVVWGAAEEPKMMKLKSGVEVDDKFAYAKVVSKAQRNALRALIPETVIKKGFETWQDLVKRVQKL